MRLVKLLVVISLAAPLAGACSSTQVEQTWKAPGTERLAFDKVLVIASSPSVAFRHKAEDLMAEKIRGATVIKSYTLLPDRESLEDKAKVDQIVRENGIDGIVMMRVVSDRTEVSYQPPSYPSSYYAFGDYYGPDYGLAPFYYDPGDVRTYKVYGVETNVYEAKEGKLVWSGLTKTTDPDDTSDLLKQTVDKVHEELRKEQLLP
jgi:hypothetical protein